MKGILHTSVSVYTVAIIEDLVVGVLSRQLSRMSVANTRASFVLRFALSHIAQFSAIEKRCEAEQKFSVRETLRANASRSCSRNHKETFT